MRRRWRQNRLNKSTSARLSILTSSARGRSLFRAYRWRKSRLTKSEIFPLYPAPPCRRRKSIWQQSIASRWKQEIAARIRITPFLRKARGLPPLPESHLYKSAPALAGRFCIMVYFYR
ncbi:hypothetical protein KCP73_16760 [Salmonella enterica subsp. enterica]|nr:hypothetical protein KCP73_16760 [Salmonella enterica subsp. enterica]